MAYGKEASVLGSQDKYRLSDNIKKYSLLDVGFMQSKGGKFQLERSLDPFSPYNQGYKLKVVIAADMQTFKLATVTANGMREVNIYKSKEREESEKQLNFILAELLDRKILEKVN
ncbi:DUF1831 domain-containing protein [Ligilactobacillus equi]|uniref:Cysteine desulfurase n=2 Tax=Ligilactobacillus equi TaxID=137357 RepID=V7HXD3_9LACO|nr:DUF1831 domain-containing protein [Ligilactobacillus equi]ETA74889.1 hypothetical protein LEQ_0286c [Ligilactobacillus equi DPC 6820]KRL85260.1 hypothetical protein FC36_GL000630 [Ligilactobacillus equi DSM 15833 = JCM 10991]MCQ2556374.1 DUF1831 domain-containing protein [Ligilactobacillus sp.]